MSAPSVAVALASEPQDTPDAERIERTQGQLNLLSGQAHPRYARISGEMIRREVERAVSGGRL